MKKQAVWIALLIAIFVSIRSFFLFTRYHLPGWDESVYIGMGKYLYSGGSIGLWESIRPPLLPLINGFFWSVGLNPIFWGEFFAIVCSIGVLIMIYVLGARWFDPRVGVVAAGLTAITPVFFFNSGLILTEMLSTLFVLLSIYVMDGVRLDGMYTRIDIKRSAFAGLFAGLAFLTKFPQGLSIIVFFTYFCYTLFRIIPKNRLHTSLRDVAHRFAPFASFLGCFMMIFLSFMGFNYVLYHQDTATIYDATLRPLILGGQHQQNVYQGFSVFNIQTFLSDKFFYVILLFKQNALLLFAFIPLIATMIGLIRLRNNGGSQGGKYLQGDKQVFLSVLLLIYLAYYSVIVNKQERFLVMMLPFIAVYASYAIITSIEYVFPEKKRRLQHNLRQYPVSTKLFFGAACGVAVSILFIAVQTDASYYHWQAPIDDPPSLVLFLEHADIAFAEHGLRGPILTMTPMFAPYSEYRYIPYYELLSEALYLNEWESQYAYDGIITFNLAFPCFPEEHACIEQRDATLSDLESANEKIGVLDDGEQRIVLLKKQQGR